MARRYEIEHAFRNSINFAPNGRRTVTTADFVRNLAVLNHDFSLKEANEWIKAYTTCFRDVSTEEGERRIWLKYNPNGDI